MNIDKSSEAYTSGFFSGQKAAQNGRTNPSVPEGYNFLNKEFRFGFGSGVRTFNRMGYPVAFPR